MTTNKTEVNSILAGLRLEQCNEVEKRKELLKALRPNKIMVDESRRKELLKASQPDNLKVAFQIMQKGNPDILQNTGNITANALANQLRFQNRQYILLRDFLNDRL